MKCPFTLMVPSRFVLRRSVATVFGGHTAVQISCNLLTRRGLIACNQPPSLGTSHLEEVYGVEVSPTLISTVTDGVLDEVKAWCRHRFEV